MKTFHQLNVGDKFYLFRRDGSRIVEKTVVFEYPKFDSNSYNLWTRESIEGLFINDVFEVDNDGLYITSKNITEIKEHLSILNTDITECLDILYKYE